LSEADRFFACPYCRVRSCIDQKGYFRFLFAASESIPENAEIIYIPYWRFKGTLFYGTLENGVANNYLDISRIALAAGVDCLPGSLGVRSQALPLKLVCAESRGRFLKPVRLKTAMHEFDRMNRYLRLKDDIVFKEYIGETASLIYSPVYVQNNRLYDGILNEPFRLSLPENIDFREMDACRPERETVFIAGLCPSCGWDLDGDAQSLTLVCRNCQSLWRPRRGQLVRVRFGCVESDNPQATWLPFWRMETDISGAPLASFADLIRLGNLPRVVQPDWENIPFYFWSPAFKVRGDIFHRLCLQLAYTQPKADLVETIGRRRIRPITLPASEGLESIKITLAAIMRPAETWLPRFSEINISPQRVTLVFLPFDERPQDFFSPDTGISINRNILIHAANL
jgi:hypothetical protein